MTNRIKLIAAAIVTCVIIVMAVFLIYKNSPSKEVMELTEYFNTSGDEMTIILQDSISEEKGYIYDTIPYLSHKMVKELFNKRFYWDSKENLLVYTTPTEMIKVAVDSYEYAVNKSVIEEKYSIVRMINDEPYIAMPFVKQYSNIDYNVYELPNRIVITYKWDEDVLASYVKKDTVVRYEGSIKSPILANVSEGDRLVYVDTAEEIKKGFSKVITEDGIIGYVKTKRLSESGYELLDTAFIPPVYSHISKDYDICMVWHQVTNTTANNGMLNLLNSTKGVNTISPTWFSVEDNEGNVSSIASESYVSRAHQAGVEVWGLCSDFSENVDMSKLLSKTSSREKLANKLLSLAIEYNLDGINIDFETIREESGEDFIQFIREMSVKCRNNGIVLSIDCYVPVDYRLYYDYEEQGEVADYVVIMAYDEHYAGSEEPGSVSSIGFVKNAVNNILAKVPAERVVMALPFYTRLWNVSVAEDGSNKVGSSAYGMSGADSILSDRGLTPSWDGETGQYYSEYVEDGKTYKIWLENEASIEEKLKAVTSGGIKNVSFWRLGFERPEIWNIVANYINAN